MQSITLKIAVRFLIPALLALRAVLCLAQYRDRGRFRYWDDNAGPIVQTEGGTLVNEDTVRTARETAPYSSVQQFRPKIRELC